MVSRLWINAIVPAIAIGVLTGCESEPGFPPPNPDYSQPELPNGNNSNPTTDNTTDNATGDNTTGNGDSNPPPVVVPPKPSRTVLAAPENPDAEVNARVQQILDNMAAKGYGKSNQGIWMQSGDTLLANYQGTVPLPAASLTKIATSLAVLDAFGPEHQFLTEIGYTGTLENGVIQGDLVIIGGKDPFFVWEDAIAIGNALSELGITGVTGNLVIVGAFYMNYEDNPKTSGALLRQGLNVQLWPDDAYLQFENLPNNTPQPQVSAGGLVKTVKSTPANIQPLLEYSSLPVAELLKKMNQYSNNPMAEMFARMVGGAGIVSQKTAELAGVPAAEIKLINGSGLGEDNKMSPRAAIALFLAIQSLLEPYNMTVGDIVAIVGEDEGILESRPLPKFTVTKSGSLYAVSALAGALPTRDRGTVWFAILNGGSSYEDFREEQEAFLNEFSTQWGAVSRLPKELRPGTSPFSKSRLKRVK
ncbi:D-alanyl-D-alanine carboxypeptidase [Roseofilum casamattae]|uniref:D-alanyl-D-alanine carboxypeptidase n=1 Tax=Roseofilum casamattae BLCC-M143 TaxID=3022442 RepID=A0ABT7BYE9_9CYAN|nr:D-alanyl-D-alanine carboxypeptidase [Roseofilum casamattae]MDJ1184224.1 D-alanyl-D-alanine carboxypeptidase [Roseofilum casamattae BLCC-M143]